jgi:MFS family permease
MNKKVNLDEIERKAYTAGSQDGLNDILIGLIYLGIALSTFLTDIGLQRPFSIILAIAPAAVVYFLGKKYITQPRLGEFKPGPKRKRKLKNLVFMSILAMTVNIVLIFLIRNEDQELLSFFTSLNPFVMSFILVSLPLMLIAYFKDFFRLYFVALLAGLAWPIAEMLFEVVGTPMDGVIAFSSIGVIILCIGLYCLRKFRTDFPVYDVEENLDED